MKKATCKQFKGPCDFEIFGTTPEEMYNNSKRHMTAMIEAGDKNHKAALEGMSVMTSEEQQTWYRNFEDAFPSLADA